MGLAEYEIEVASEIAASQRVFDDLIINYPLDAHQGQLQRATRWKNETNLLSFSLILGDLKDMSIGEDDQLGRRLKPEPGPQGQPQNNYVFRHARGW